MKKLMLKFGLVKMTVAALFLLATSPAHAQKCVLPKPTEIIVKPASQDVRLYAHKSLKEMQSISTDTIDPHSFGGVSVMQGFAKTGIRMTGRAELDYEQLPGQYAACVWYDKVVVNFEMDPAIHIAKEVYADPCMRRAVYDHEMKHVMTDRKIINQYSNIIANKLYTELKKRGFIVGPVPGDQMQQVANRMNDTVGQIINHEYKRLELDRMDAQRAVDSIEEYERVSGLCPHFKVTPDMLEGRNTRRTTGAYRR